METEPFGPMEVVVITSGNNAMPCTWWMKVSYEPKIYAISVSKKRYTNELITKSRKFKMNFISSSKKEKIIKLGKVSGREVFKLEIMNELKDDLLSVVECNVTNRFEEGDHVLFIGEVTKEERFKKGKRLLHTSGGVFNETQEEW